MCCLQAYVNRNNIRVLSSDLRKWKEKKIHVLSSDLRRWKEKKTSMCCLQA